MKTAARTCLLVLLLCTTAHPCVADDDVCASPWVDDLWAEYQKVRKIKDVEADRTRTHLAIALGEIGSEEALEKLLKIFEKDKAVPPRLEAMKALCGRGDLRVVSRVVKKAKNDKSCLRLWLGEVLAGARDPAVGPWIVKKSRLLSKADFRICAVEALGRLGTPEAREPLLKLYQKHQRSTRAAPLVYETLVALGRIGGNGVRETLIEAAGSEHPWKRLAAAEVLLTLAPDDDAEAVEACSMAMIRLLDDADGLVREVAVRAVGAAKGESLVPNLLPRLSDSRRRVRPAARAALTAIAGADLGANCANWDAWWNARRAGERPPTVAKGKDDDRIAANGVIILLDTSKSMQWQLPDTTRLEVAQTKVVALLRRLHEDCVFNVIAVCGKAYAWQKIKGRSGGLVPATPDNVEAAVQWVEGIECRVHTNTWDALEMAIESHEKVDTIYYVTDGAIPLGGYVSKEEIPMRLHDINRLRKVVVHISFLMWGSVKSWAVKYEKAEEQEAFLSALAAQTGGTFETQRYP